MEIRFKLIGLLKRRQSPLWDQDSGAGVLNTEHDLSVEAALERLGIPERGDDILVVVNDQVVPPSERGSLILRGDDQLTLMPPMQGG